MLHPNSPPIYVLGHDDHELRRLEHQGRFLGALTGSVLQRAGLRPGMRVLDVGAGAGDVTLLAAALVGEGGEVVALDRAPAAVARVNARLGRLGLRQARGLLGDANTIESLAGDGFDSIIGRLVLLHQRDPANTIAALARHLRPGGRMAFHEIEIGAGWWSSAPLPTFAQAWRWITGVFSAGGMATDISTHIAAGFDRGGLTQAQILREGRVERGPDSGAYVFMASTVQSLLAPIERLGLARAEEVDIDTLADRLREEAVTAEARFIPVHLCAAWAERPVA